MASAAPEGRLGSNPFHDLVEALADRQGEISLRLEHMTLRFPLLPEPIELNGDVSVSIHFRALSDKEKGVLVSREVRRLQK